MNRLLLIFTLLVSPIVRADADDIAQILGLFTPRIVVAPPVMVAPPPALYVPPLLAPSEN